MIEDISWRSGQVVRRRSRKPKITGSNPVCALFCFQIKMVSRGEVVSFCFVVGGWWSYDKYLCIASLSIEGLVAQWITRLTTDQKIPGSNPGELDF